MSFTKRLSLSWTALNGTMRVGARMGPPKEELEDELPPEEKEEDLFILKIWKGVEVRVTFRKRQSQR